MPGSSVLVSTAYFGPISLYAALFACDEATIEAQEYFIKQTYRNRCEILGANGLQALSIPIQERKNKSIVKDIKIDYKSDWQTQHWRSIESAYNSSPFFEYLQDDIYPLQQQKTTFLIDYNFALQEKMLELLGKKMKSHFTESYLKEHACDLRQAFSPKQKRGFNFPDYIQVFENKFEFVPDLSILDLIFNLGNASEIYLRKVQAIQSI